VKSKTKKPNAKFEFHLVLMTEEGSCCLHEHRKSSVYGSFAGKFRGSSFGYEDGIKVGFAGFKNDEMLFFIDDLVHLLFFGFGRVVVVIVVVIVVIVVVVVVLRCCSLLFLLLLLTL